MCQTEPIGRRQSGGLGSLGPSLRTWTVAFVFVAHHSSIGFPRAFKSRPLPSYQALDLSPQLHEITHSPLSILSPSPPKPFHPRIRPKSCLTPRGNHGPTIQTLQRSHTTCTLRGRPILPEFSLARFSMVCTRYLHLLVRLTTQIPPVPLILGMLIVLFFQCVAALLNPEPCGRGYQVGTRILHCGHVLVRDRTQRNTANSRSSSYIDNREFRGVEGFLPPGPFGYLLFTWSRATTIATSPMFLLNYWLADGFLVGVCLMPFSPAHMTNSSMSSSIVAM